MLQPKSVHQIRLYWYIKLKISQPYLTKSAVTGVYGYRRRVLPKHRRLFADKHEIKRSFKTKDIKIALRLLEDMNDWFDSVIATKGLKEFSASTPPRQIRRMIAHDLKIRGLLTNILSLSALAPAQGGTDKQVAPYLQYVAIDQQRRVAAEKFFDIIEKIPDFDLDELVDDPPREAAPYKITMDELAEQLSGIEERNPNNPYLSHYMQLVAETAITRSELRWLEWEASDLENSDELIQQNQYRISLLKGETPTIPDTWRNAVEEYIVSQKDEVRNKSQERHWLKTTLSACERLSRYLLHGMDTKLGDIARADVEDAVREIWPNPSTRKRGTRIFQAVVNSWNTRFPDQAVPNMFLRLVSDTAVKNAKRDRRSFSPEEYDAVWDLVNAEADSELRLIATLGLYAGIPNGEVAGLDLYDLRLDGSSPHIKIRDNAHRVLGKKRRSRAVPLVGFVLDAVRDFVKNRDFTTNTRLFPSFATKDGGTDNGKLSKCLRKFVVHKIKTDGRIVSWYSSRHTFKDICDVAGISGTHTRYLMGHAEEGGGSHKDYGTKPPVTSLAVDMKKVLNWRDYQWGDYDQ